MALPNLEPLGLQEIRSSFDSDEWAYEVKFDGFRCLAYIEGNNARLVSRTGHVYKRFADLRERIANDIDADEAILDGELVVLDSEGKSQFNELMRSRSVTVFATFDLLWADGEDLRNEPLVERKETPSQVAQEKRRTSALRRPHQGACKALFAETCKRDLEGVVAKPLASPYRNIRGQSPWIKIRNPKYTQKKVAVISSIGSANSEPPVAAQYRMPSPIALSALIPKFVRTSARGTDQYSDQSTPNNGSARLPSW